MARKSILLVDDEAKALKYFTKAFSDRFRIFSTSSAEEALAVLKAHHEEIGVIVTDQRMPESSGVNLLRAVRRHYPQTVRILTTAYSELDVLVEAINTSAVYSFVSKPWRLDELERTLVEALDHHERQVATHRILERKLQEFREGILDGDLERTALVAGKIGHYVHNALCPVTLFIDQLLTEKNGGQDLPEEFLTNVRAHVFEISKMLKDLAQLTSSPKREDYVLLDLAELLESAMTATEVVRLQKKIVVQAKLTDSLPVIWGVRSQIEKLIRFMITEEAVSLSAGSRVDVRLGPHMGDGEVLGVKLEFEDFEPLREEIRSKDLLHPFNLRGANPREFGIFLASSYFIANHHGGSLTVRIKDDQSLILTVLLPCIPDAFHSLSGIS